MAKRSMRSMLSAALQGKEKAAEPAVAVAPVAVETNPRGAPVITMGRRSPLGHVARQGRYGADRPGGPGVILAVRHPVSIVSVIARNGKVEELSQSLRTHFGLDCPPPGHSSGNGRMALHWCSFEQWYAVADGFPEGALYEQLGRNLSGLVSLADQSHGRLMLRVAGPRSRDLLAKGTPVDLHPRAFGPERSAVTQMAHVGVHFAQVGPDAFEVSVPRGFAESFWEWLTEMAAEYGYEVR